MTPKFFMDVFMLINKIQHKYVHFSNIQFPLYFIQLAIDKIVLDKKQHEEPIKKAKSWTMEDDKMLIGLTL